MRRGSARPTNTGKKLATASKLFGIDLVQVAAISMPGPTTPWRSDIILVNASAQGTEYVYKSRAVTPFELLEIEAMLSKLHEAHIPNLCRIIEFKLFNHRIHLLLERVTGMSLDHWHDEDWTNEP